MVHGTEKSKLVRQRPSAGSGGTRSLPNFFGETTGSTRRMCYALLVHSVLGFLGTLFGSYDPGWEPGMRFWFVVVGVAAASIALIAPFLVARRMVFGLKVAWGAFWCLIAQALFTIGTLPSMLYLNGRSPNDSREFASPLVLLSTVVSGDRGNFARSLVMLGILVSGGLAIVIVVGLVSRDTAIYLRLPKPLSQDEEDAAEADSSQAP